MNYIELFNLLYSTRISESLKETIINKLENYPITEEINECSSEVEACIQLVDTLAESSITEDVMFSAIEEAFSKMDEEFINEVSDEYIKRKAQAGLKQREKAYKEVSSNPVGLSQIDRVGSKLDKAKALNIKIIDEEMFKSLIKT